MAFTVHVGIGKPILNMEAVDAETVLLAWPMGYRELSSSSPHCLSGPTDFSSSKTATDA